MHVEPLADRLRIRYRVDGALRELSSLLVGLARPIPLRMKLRAELTEGGRGLRVVDALATRWGSFRVADARGVWCDFGQPLHAGPGGAWAWLHLVLSVCSLSDPGRLVAAVMPGAPAPMGAR